jgi:type IV secretory pathway TraG/TraD family ATPase VirD4
MMSQVTAPTNWGPSDQTRRRRTPTWFRLLGAAAVAGWLLSSTGSLEYELPIPAALALLGMLLLFRDIARKAPSTATAKLAADAGDPLTAVKQLARQQGNGVYLGAEDRGGLRFSRAQRAVLVLGPPRSGKTSAVIVPALIAHDGPAVCTSTKTDVSALTRAARGRCGRLWVFDPTAAGTPSGFAGLRWSPVTGARSWEQALLTARAMTANVGAGTAHGSHWANRAQALLAPLLHAAAIDGRDMETVTAWVMRHELNDAGIVLERETASRLAFGSLVGVFNTEARERASIFSAAADALVAYNSEAALQAATEPNFDPTAFVASQDTVYILAPAEEQAAAAPIVCALLSEVRRATYLAHRQGSLRGRVLLALDEAANIAPLEELPAIASEGGGQGLTLLAAFQDLSQARQRWGSAADGFLTLFGTKLIFAGIADNRTLETISVTLGEYDRQVEARTRPSGGLIAGLLANQPSGHPSTTISTQRTRVLSPGEIANIPPGRALHLDGVRWELLTSTPAYSAEPWKTLTALPSA